MFYVSRSYYDSYEVIAQFESREDATRYADYMNLADSYYYYEVEDFSSLPLNPEVLLVMKKGRFARHFPDLESAEEWISKRKTPSDYVIYGRA